MRKILLCELTKICLCHSQRSCLLWEKFCAIVRLFGASSFLPLFPYTDKFKFLQFLSKNVYSITFPAFTFTILMWMDMYVDYSKETHLINIVCRNKPKIRIGYVIARKMERTDSLIQIHNMRDIEPY